MAVDKRTQKWLREGITAVRRGQRERARTLLRQVLEQEAGSAEAWWWLSQAAGDPAEQQHALQRVVALNPDHPEAHARLVELRLQRLPAASAAPTPAPPEPDVWADNLPGVPLEADDGVDNPFQCPYCGQPTGSDDRRCPHCRAGLYRRVAVSRSSDALRRLQLVLGIGLGAGILELAAPLLALGYRQGTAAPANYELLLAVPGVQSFLGNFLSLAPATIDLLLKSLLVRTALYVVLILGLRARWRLAYYGTMLGMLADVLFSVYLLVAGHLGWAGLLLNMVLALGAALILFAVSYEFAVNHERLLVRPDGHARGPQDYYRRGHAYRRQGMWAMAVAQWRKAVGLAPHVPVYYKDLGLGYAQIGRYDRSLRALHEARRQSPEPEELDQIIALVEARAQQERARS